MDKLVLKIGKNYAITVYDGLTEMVLKFKKDIPIEVSEFWTLSRKKLKTNEDSVIKYLLALKKLFRDGNDIITRPYFELIKEKEEEEEIKKKNGMEKKDSKTN